jgi:dTDP-4-dehydrorhamnose reductase
MRSELSLSRYNHIYRYEDSSVIWLIGNKGMLGSDVEEALKEKKFQYAATDLEVDITDIETLRRFVRDKTFKWIINCSAYTAVDRAEVEPVKAFQVNAQGPLNIAEIANQIGAKLIHISTDYVFDGEKDGAYTEDDIPNPMCVYGKSKLEGEKNIQNVFENFIIIRTAWLYGKNGKNFVNTMLKLFDERDSLKVVSDQWGSPTYTKDLSGTILHIVQFPKTEFGIYHFTNDGKTSWYNFAKKIYDLGKKSSLINKEVGIVRTLTAEYSTRARRPRNSFLSKDRIRAVFDVDIRGWEHALGEYIESLA